MIYEHVRLWWSVQRITSRLIMVYEQFRLKSINYALWTGKTVIKCTTMSKVARFCWFVSPDLFCTNNTRRFRCADRKTMCLPIEYRCDGDRNCADGSDEWDCGEYIVTANVAYPHSFLFFTIRVCLCLSLALPSNFKCCVSSTVNRHLLVICSHVFRRNGTSTVDRADN